jgi:hypothetical protein
MDLFHKIQGIIDANTPNIPEGDYLELCNALGKLRERVKPPKFLLDQNEPLMLPQYEPTIQVAFFVPYPDGQPQEWIDQE